MTHVHLFLSAVSDEFRSYRDTLLKLLTRPNVVVQVQEDFIPTGTETLDKLDSYIASCDAVIHLVGDMTGAWARNATTQAVLARYGDVGQRMPPLGPSLQSGDPPLSYTQWEAYLAVYHQKPLVIAVPAPGTPRDGSYRIEAERQAAQQAHLVRLHALGRYPEITFTGTDQLALQVLRSSILDLLVKAEVVSAMDDFKNVFGVARSLSRESARLQRAERARRMEMGSLFEQIGSCLAAVADAIRADVEPHGRCRELFTYAQRLPNTVRKELGDDEAERLGRLLLSAFDVEGLALRLQNVSKEKGVYLREIDEAAGEFQALANLVRLG
jgi:hypothetical protein